MNSELYQPIVHRFALLTVCAALLPIAVGALVTTTKSGMAFPDWPSSDGHNMFLYPWLDAAFDKFIEHGHRLAGILVGVVSIGLAVVTCRKDPRKAVRVMSVLVLLGVILQGVLGGIRVRMNSELLAMIHGSFAALVFSLMAAVMLVTSRSWRNYDPQPDDDEARSLKPFAVGLALAIFGQYVLGGLLRHLGLMLHEHIGLAVIVFLFAIGTFVFTHFTRISWLQRTAQCLVVLLVLQVALGVGTFVTKFGFAPTGYVAVYGSIPQVVLATTHQVVGALLFMTSVMYAVRVFRASLPPQSPSVLCSASNGLEQSGAARGGVG